MRKDQIRGPQRPRQGTAHDHIDVAQRSSDVIPPPGLWPDPAPATSGPHRTCFLLNCTSKNAQHGSMVQLV